MTLHLENTHKAKISTIKTTKFEKYMKLKSQASVQPINNKNSQLQPRYIITATRVNLQSVVDKAHYTITLIDTLTFKTIISKIFIQLTFYDNTNKSLKQHFKKN